MHVTDQVVYWKLPTLPYHITCSFSCSFYLNLINGLSPCVFLLSSRIYICRKIDSGPNPLSTISLYLSAIRFGGLGNTATGLLG